MDVLKSTPAADFQANASSSRYGLLMKAPLDQNSSFRRITTDHADSAGGSSEADVNFGENTKLPVALHLFNSEKLKTRVQK